MFDENINQKNLELNKKVKIDKRIFDDHFPLTQEFYLYPTKYILDDLGFIFDFTPLKVTCYYENFDSFLKVSIFISGFAKAYGRDDNSEEIHEILNYTSLNLSKDKEINEFDINDDKSYDLEGACIALLIDSDRTLYDDVTILNNPLKSLLHKEASANEFIGVQANSENYDDEECDFDSYDYDDSQLYNDNQEDESDDEEEFKDEIEQLNEFSPEYNILQSLIENLDNNFEKLLDLNFNEREDFLKNFK